MAKDDLFSRIGQAAKNRVQRVLNSTKLDENISTGLNRVKQSFKNDPGQYLPTRSFKNLRTNPITAPQTGTIARAGNQVLENVGKSQPVQFAVKNFAQPYLNTQNKPLRVLQQVAKGYGTGANLGLVQGPGPQPRGASENIANVVGGFAGAMNPYSASGKFYKGVNAATNPYLSKVVGRFAPGVAQRGASAVANVVQGIGIDKGLGQQTSPLSVGVDAVSGLAMGRAGFDVPNAKGFGTGRNSSIPWTKEDTDLLDSLMQYMRDNPKLDKETLNLIDNEMSRLADGYLYKSQIEKLMDSYKGTPKVGKNNTQQKQLLLKMGEELQKSYRNVGEEFNIPKLGIMAGQNATGYKDATKFSSLLDQKPRFEIDDSGAKLKLPWEKDPNFDFSRSVFKLDEILDHDELYKNYPETRKIFVRFEDGAGGGVYQPNRNMITLSSPDTAKSTLLHEIQHAIQEVEGFARGGSPQRFGGEVANEINNVRRNIGHIQNAIRNIKEGRTPIEAISKKYGNSIPELENSLKKLTIDLSKIREMDEVTRYQRLSGELEARAVQRRMDVPEESQIETLYRGYGDSPGSSPKIGNYFSTDKNFAREFTGTGLESEIRKINVLKSDIYEPKKLPFAGNVEEMDKAISEAKKLGYKAIRVNEGLNQPNSVFFIDPNMVSNNTIKTRQNTDPYAAEARATTGTANPSDFITQFGSGNQASLRIKPQDQPKLKLKTDKVPGQIDRTKLVGSNLGKSNASLERIFGDNAAPIVKAVDPKNKVNLLDYIRTPEKVLKKLGLEKNAKLIQKKYGDYLEDLPKEINKVTEWYQRVGKSQDSSQRIFQWLDGKKDTPLDPVELQVAKEMQAYLEQWADKLQLPKDKRIASYITHIFDDDFIQKDFDPDLAKIISDKIPGEVYDPFLQERLGKLGYVEDAFRALDAYTKRATRKYHMDQALNPLRRAVGKTAEESHLDLDSWQYVKSYVDNVNMRPQKVDRLLDDMIKALPGGQSFGSRPTSRITKKLRTMVYRGTLGLNMGSALKNLTQGVNTYAELGEKYTAIGYTKAMLNLARKDPELNRVLSDSFIQDRNLSAKKQLIQKMDKGLFVFFDFAEKINRSSAYYGAKSKALAQGMNEQAAKQFAEDVVRKTQFTFGSVDTPVVMQGDIAKTLLQFQSFNIKQAEFLGEMIKNKEFGKMMRWLGANLLVITAFGDLLGMDIKDLIPTVKVGGSPIFQLGGDLFKAAVDAPDRYGNDQDAEDKIRTIGKDTVPFIPAGVQIKKTIEGQRAVEQGKAIDRAGRTKFEVPNTAYNRIVAPTLGVYRTSEAQDYYDKQSGKSQATLLERLLQPKSEVSASDSIILPKTEQGRTYLYNQDKKIIDNYEQDVIDTQYKTYADEDNRQKRLDELEQRYQGALSRQEMFDKDYPQLSKDAEYESKATTGNYDDRYSLIKNELRQVFNPTSKKEVFDYLAQNQRKVNGKKLVTVPVLDDLYKEGIITKFERDLLKSVSFTKDGQIKFKLPTTLSGSSRKRKVFTFKPSKINYTKLRINVPELPRIKTQFNTARLNTPVLPRVKLA